MAAVTCARCSAPIGENEVFCTQCGAARPRSAFDLPYARRRRVGKWIVIGAAACLVIGGGVLAAVLATNKDDGHAKVSAQAAPVSATSGVSHAGVCGLVDRKTLGNVISTTTGPVRPALKYLGVATPASVQATSCDTLFLSPQSFGDVGPEVAGLRVTVEQYPTEEEATARLTAIGDHARSTRVGDTDKVRVNPDTSDVSRDVRDESASFGAGAVAFERNDSFEHVVFRVGDKVVALTCDTSLTDMAQAVDFDSALLARMEPAARAMQKAL
jgi:hypothetical protein